MSIENQTETVLKSMKDAFAPVTEALQNMQVPEATRDFVKRAAGTAKTKTDDLHAGSEKVTAAVESVVTNSVSEAAKISRSIQAAFFQDAATFYAGIDKLASARSFNEAVQIQTDLARAHGETVVGRAKASTEYVSNLFSESAKAAQANFAKFTPKSAA